MLESSARLLRLLSTLQSRRAWPGAELAERLEVTPRTLRRDVDKLRSLGYAVDATAGHGGGYQLGTGTAMPPLLLDDEEAIAVAVALRTATDSFAGLGETALRVLAKLEQLLPGRLRRRLGALQAMTVSVHRPSAVDPDRLAALAAACRDDAALAFDYRRHDGATSRREVEPLRLAHAWADRWYLVAWDRARGDWRTFRVDRIEGPIAVGARFVPRPPPDDLAAYVKDALSLAPYPLRATAKIRGALPELAASIPTWCGVLEPLDEEHCLLRTGADSIEGLACNLLLCGREFTLLEPADLAPQLQALAARLARAAAS